MTHVVRPKLVVSTAAEALDFYARALDAREVVRFVAGETVVFAEMEVLGVAVTLKDADGADPVPEPGPIIEVVTDDPDGVFDSLVAAGAASAYPMSDQPWGGRWGRARDPYGVQWLLQSPTAATTEEIQSAVDAMR